MDVQALRFSARYVALVLMASVVGLVLRGAGANRPGADARSSALHEPVPRTRENPCVTEPQVEVEKCAAER